MDHSLDARPPLNELSPYIPGLTQPVVGFNGGISRLLLERSSAQGPICILRTYASQAEGDFIELFCEDSVTPVDFHTVTEQEASEQKPIILHLPLSRLPDGTVSRVFFRVTHLDNTREQTQQFRLKVDTVPPGGRDPVASTPENENLPKPRLPTFIDAQAASRGVPVLIDFYPVDTTQPIATYRAVRDRLRLRIGGKIVEQQVTENEAAGRGAITIMVYYGSWIDVGSGIHMCALEVVDEVDNFSVGISAAQRIEVQLGQDDKRLPAAFIEQAPNGVLDADQLAGNDATVIVTVQGNGYNRGDIIEVKIQGRTTAGVDLEQTYNTHIESDTAQFARIPWPNADVLLLVGARNIQLSYERVRSGAPNLPSGNTFIEVIGTPVDTALLAPQVPAAVGGVLPPQSDPVLVQIRHYTGQHPDDRVTLILEGTYANGHMYYQEFETRAGSDDIEFSLRNGPDGDIARLEGGHLRLYYIINSAVQRPPSQDLIIDIGAPQAALPPVQILQAPPPEFTFNPDISRGNANVTVPTHPAFTDGATVILHVEGSTPGSSAPPARFPISPIWVGQDLPFVVARTFILANLNGSARVYYTVEKTGHRTLYSLAVMMHVGGSLHLPAPWVLESTVTGPSTARLNPLHVLPPAPPTVTFRVSYTMLASDDIQPVFQGSYGLGTPIISPKPGNPGQGFVDFILSNQVVAANLGRNAILSYTVTRSGATSPSSQALTLTIDNLPELRLDVVSVPQASGAVINVSQVNSVLAQEWPFMATGQKVWIDIKAAANLNLRDGTPLSAQEFSAKRVETVLPSTYLNSLPFLSVLRVEAYVSLNGSPHKELATALRPVSYRIDNPRGVAVTIPVRGTPTNLALSADGLRLYVTCATTPRSVSVIDTQTYRVIETIERLGSPIWLAINPSQERLYVTDNSRAVGTPVNVINTRDNTVTDTLTGFTTVNGLTVNSTGTRLYVADNGASQLVVIDTGTHQPIARIPVNSPIEIALSPDNSRAHIAAFFDWAIVDLTNNIPIGSLNTVSRPQKIAHSPRGTKVYMTYPDRGTVIIGDTLNQRIDKTLTDLQGPYGVAFHPRLERAYVTQTRGGLLAIIDTRTQNLIGTFAGFNQPRGVVVSPDGDVAYVANAGNDTVSLVVV